MKRLLFILTLVFCVLAFAAGQKVDSIKVEQTGDYIRISYKLLNSEPGEIYRVRALVSVDGGPNIELRSVSGDTGENVQGGKPEYFIVWDVLKDMNELRSAEFIVRAEKVIQNISREGKNNKSFSLMPVVQFPGPGFGGRISYLGKVGFSAQYVNGKTAFVTEYLDQKSTWLNRISFGLTFRLFGSETDQIHLLIGPAIGQNWIVERSSSPSATPIDFNLHYSPGFESGLLFCQRFTIFGFSVQKLLPDITEEGEAITKTLFFNASFGLRF
jgi:hypothetical protein